MEVERLKASNEACEKEKEKSVFEAKEKSDSLTRKSEQVDILNISLRDREREVHDLKGQLKSKSDN